MNTHEITVIDVFLAIAACVMVVAIGLSIRELGVHRPRRRNAPAPRPKPLCDGGKFSRDMDEVPPDLEPVTVCGSWPINPGDRVRLLISVPEYGTEIGHAATLEAIWPGDDDMYRFKLDGRHGRDAIITFFGHELWQLEKIPS